MTAPLASYPTPVLDSVDSIVDLAALFPSYIPRVEQIVYDTVRDACSRRTVFPEDGQGLTLPAAFQIAPDVSLFRGTDETSMFPSGEKAGQPIPSIPVIKGWPAYPGAVPAIGVAESTTDEDDSEDSLPGGFAGDVFASDANGNVIATAAYYAEPLTVTVVVELIHTNRDERDRLTDELRRVLQPLKHLIANQSPQVRKVRISSEKQDLPLDEQPLVMYVAVFTVQVNAEALIPTAITAPGVIAGVTTTVNPTQIEPPSGQPDFT